MNKQNIVMIGAVVTAIMVGLAYLQFNRGGSTESHAAPPDPARTMRESVSGPEIEAFKTQQRLEFSRCEPFLHEDPFASLEKREGGYPAEYWNALALANKDPLAISERLIHGLAGLSESRSQDVEQRARSLEQDLRFVVMSKDPWAIFRAGIHGQHGPGNGERAICKGLCAGSAD